MTSACAASTCIPWQGPGRMHQAEALSVLEGQDRQVPRWGWIVVACDTPNCVAPDHLVVHRPTSLAYPARLCIYCGRPGSTRDHLLPRPWTGDAERIRVATVPACGLCNGLLNDSITTTITERRALAHERIRRHFRKVLRTVDHSPEQLDEYGPTLRAYITESIEKKAEINEMLTWPTDPLFDLRALQKSGIEDPYASGLLA